MKKSTAKKPAKKPAPKKTMKQAMTKRQPSKSATAATVRQAPPPSKAVPAPKVPGAMVMTDHQRRTCIVFDRDLDCVRYVAIDVENGLDLVIADPQSFDERFKPLADYPVEKAAKLYVEYARGLGATEQVMRMLGKLTTVNHEDIEMAAAKKTARAKAPVKTDKKPGKDTTAAATKTAATKTAGAKATKTADKKPKEAKEKKPRGPSAAQRFQELLMLEGPKKGVAKHTDDEIFGIVKKEFGLSDDKRSYVKWYRNYLCKQGKTPPAAKE